MNVGKQAGSIETILNLQSVQGASNDGAFMHTYAIVCKTLRNDERKNRPIRGLGHDVATTSTEWWSTMKKSEVSVS